MLFYNIILKGNEGFDTTKESGSKFVETNLYEMNKFSVIVTY